MDSIPSMTIGGKTPLAEFPVNGTFYVAIYQGSLSQYDVLIKYRQLENGKWSRIRTPKHIHWAVDILIKQHLENFRMLLFYIVNNNDVTIILLQIYDLRH